MRKYSLVDIFEWIINYKAEHDGNSPTVRQIGKGVGIPSTSVVRYNLDEMERNGWIHLLRDGSTRGIVVVGGHWSME